MNMIRPVALIASTACLGACSLSRPDTADDASQVAWALVWSDEFDGPEIDRTKWGFDVDCWGGGNEERQCYTDREKNARIVDSKLIIEAHKEAFAGPALPAHMRSAGVEPVGGATKPFTSARLSTHGHAAWRYGRIEIRAKLPQGQGVWPAIWMLPEHDTYGPWASSGEIDILEAVNLGVDCNDGCERGGENTILGTLHFGGAWPDNDLASTEISYPPALEGFHTYGVIWQEGRMQWTVDGQIYAEKTSQDWWTAASDNANAPFDQPFHVILNLAIGGGLPEERGAGGVDESGFPKTLEIDWVRVWQCSNNALGGSHCPSARSRK